MNFIELTGKDGKKFIGNINLLQSVFTTKEGITAVVGWNNNGWMEVKEDYETVLKMVNARMAGVNTLQTI